jgi:hypothetical protein
MRRDYFTLAVTNVEEGTERPTVHIDFEGPTDAFLERATDEAGEPLAGDHLDVTCRLQEPLGDDTMAVASVTNRETGEYVLELDTDAADVLAFVAAVQAEGEDDRCYRVEVTIDGEVFATVEKGTFLVYDHEGELLRAESLIPPGIEL